MGSHHSLIAHLRRAIRGGPTRSFGKARTPGSVGRLDERRLVALQVKVRSVGTATAGLRRARGCPGAAVLDAHDALVNADHVAAPGAARRHIYVALWFGPAHPSDRIGLPAAQGISTDPRSECGELLIR